MPWDVTFHFNFLEEFEEFNQDIQDDILAKTRILQEFGPQLGRPHVDTLKGSKFSNMKELRLETDNGVWRVAFTFDPERNAILLVAGDKKGKDQKRFYKNLIKKADTRFSEHLNNLSNEKE